MEIRHYRQATALARIEKVSGAAHA
jgi:hypothetical protein